MSDIDRISVGEQSSLQASVACHFTPDKELPFHLLRQGQIFFSSQHGMLLVKRGNIQFCNAMSVVDGRSTVTIHSDTIVQKVKCEVAMIEARIPQLPQESWLQSSKAGA